MGGAGLLHRHLMITTPFVSVLEGAVVRRGGGGAEFRTYFQSDEEKTIVRNYRRYSDGNEDDHSK